MGADGTRRAMTRAPAAALAMAGLLLVVAGFGYDLVFAGLPYQDPTPAMQAAWTRHQAIAGVIVRLGLGLVLAGGVVAIARRLRRRRRE